MPTIIETEKKMRNRGRWLLGAGWMTFAVSLVLPAFRGLDWMSGWLCFRFVIDVLVDGPAQAGGFGSWLYWSGFALANLIFITSPLLIRLFRGDIRRLRRLALLMAVATAQTASYWCLALPQGWHTVGDFHIGYYAWVLSFGLVTAGALHLALRRPKSMVNQRPESLARTPDEIRALRELEQYLQGIDLPRRKEEALAG